jgi:hypothetical protein
MRKLRKNLLMLTAGMLLPATVISCDPGDFAGVLRIDGLDIDFDDDRCGGWFWDDCGYDGWGGWSRGWGFDIDIDIDD